MTFASGKSFCALARRGSSVTSNDGRSVATFGAESEHTRSTGSLLAVLSKAGGPKFTAVSSFSHKVRRRAQKSQVTASVRCSPRAWSAERSKGRKGVSGHALADRCWKLCFHDDADGTPSDVQGVGRVSWRATRMPSSMNSRVLRPNTSLRATWCKIKCQAQTSAWAPLSSIVRKRLCGQTQKSQSLGEYSSVLSARLFTLDA